MCRLCWIGVRLTLRGLQRDGLVTRTMYPSIPPRVDYELTKSGRSLLGPVMALVNWANENQDEIAEAQRSFDARPELDISPTQGLVHRIAEKAAPRGA